MYYITKKTFIVSCTIKYLSKYFTLTRKILLMICSYLFNFVVALK